MAQMSVQGGPFKEITNPKFLEWQAARGEHKSPFSSNMRDRFHNYEAAYLVLVEHFDAPDELQRAYQAVQRLEEMHPALSDKVTGKGVGAAIAQAAREGAAFPDDQVARLADAERARRHVELGNHALECARAELAEEFTRTFQEQAKAIYEERVRPQALSALAHVDWLAGHTSSSFNDATAVYASDKLRKAWVDLDHHVAIVRVATRCIPWRKKPKRDIRNWFMYTSNTDDIVPPEVINKERSGVDATYGKDDLPQDLKRRLLEMSRRGAQWVMATPAEQDELYAAFREREVKRNSKKPRFGAVREREKMRNRDISYQA